MPAVSHLRVHPVKTLNPIEVEAASIARGGLEYDRKYALFDENDEYVSRKDNDRAHRLRITDFDTETDAVSLRVRGESESRTFRLGPDRSELEAWLSEYFGEPITVGEASDTRFTGVAGGSIPMEISAPGPSVVSTSTYEEIATWFDGLDVDGLRDRFRANIEVGGVPPFWEDRLYSDKDHVVKFRVGDVAVTGVLPLSRCSVPTKDPETGEQYPDFAQTFIEHREAKFPAWADADHLGHHLPTRNQHYYYLTVVTRIPTSETGKSIRIGDDVELIGEVATIKAL